MTKTLRIAILSDLHCQGFVQSKKRRESYLAAADPRVPGTRHPVQSLINLIEDKRNDVSAEVTICVGDLTHQIAEDGFSAAWGLVSELKAKFGSEYCFSTLGNHDTNSRSNSGDPFRIAKTIHPEFPFPNREDSNCYWANGYCLQSVPNYADFLMINTSYDHYSKELAKRGSFDITQIDSLKIYLEKNCKNKLRIAVMHHNPIVHSFDAFGSTEVLTTGDQLIKVLSHYGFRLIIHGHRHEPRISRYNSDGNQLHIFSAGSLAVFLNELSSVTRNLFHLLELKCDDDDRADYVTGTIRSWEFNLGSGWNPSSLKSADFPHIVNIGPIPPLSLADDINSYFSAKGDEYIVYEQLIKEFEALGHMLPEEIVKLRDNLQSAAQLKIEINDLGTVRGLGKLYQSNSGGAQNG